jgi:hypothetical protein
MACWAHGLRQLLTTQLDSRLGRSRHFSFTTQASFLQILLTYPMQIGSPQSLGLNSIWSPYLLSYNYIAYPHLFCNICSRPLFTIKLSLFTYAFRGSLVSNCELTVKVLSLDPCTLVLVCLIQMKICCQRRNRRSQYQYPNLIMSGCRKVGNRD